ncbi:MAG TPA: hypothetical protein VH643_13800 [Gemmataceae bacterium]|jgi:hypothetical protein
MANLFLPPAGRGKRTILWAAIYFVCAQAALGVYLNWRRPDVRDPAYGLRLLTLRQRMAENPAAPLVLILGSSRTLNGMSPAHMHISRRESEPEPLVYNFALAGSGSVRELMTFRRLRAAGIKPDWLLIESWPVLWPEDGIFAERRVIADDELCWTDLTVLSRYLPGKVEFFGRALKGNLAPLVSYRSRLLHAGAHFLLPRDLDRTLTHEENDWTCTDGMGWLPYRKLPADLEAQRREVAKGLLVAAPLLNPLRIAPDSDRALRDLLDECRAEGIKVALFLMPEHSECRRWYSPQTHAVVSGYLTELTRQYGVPALDLRDWAPDEHFADFCHMAPWGAEPFSERFGRDVVRPLLRNEPLERTVLLRTP